MTIKNKKIFSVTMVKNEMDIIESFIRYNLNILDGMIILDNGSTDSTLNIIKCLKDEGYPVFYIEDENIKYQQDKKMSQLLKIAVDEFEADIIIPLDVDEFITSNHHGNPRTILKKLESPNYYLVKWKTYIPDFGKNVNNKFIPSQITFVRDEKLEQFYKVIIPKELITDYSVKLTFGNHDLIYDQKFRNIIKSVNNPDLAIAHFPIRSKEQTLSKVIVGWINLPPEIKMAHLKMSNYHWQKMFKHIKEFGEIQNKDVIDFAKKFALESEDIQVNIEEDPMDISFCKNIEIKYTNDKFRPISNILEHFDLTYKESLDREQLLLNKIEDLNMELNNLSDLKLLEEKHLKNKLERYENSKSWMITSPLRKISTFIRKKRN
jgi:Glycosyl transferase family 2